MVCGQIYVPVAQACRARFGHGMVPRGRRGLLSFLRSSASSHGHPRPSWTPLPSPSLPPGARGPASVAASAQGKHGTHDGVVRDSQRWRRRRVLLMAARSDDRDAAEQRADDPLLVVDVPSILAGGGTAAAGPRAINFFYNKNYSTTSNAVAARPCDGDSAEQPAIDPLVVVDAPSLLLWTIRRS